MRFSQTGIAMTPREELKQVHWLDSYEAFTNKTPKGVQIGVVGLKLDHPPKVHHCKQVHGIQLVQAGETTEPTSSQRPDADSLYTLSENIPIAVKTADCVPILIYSADPNFAMAIHAGWRGFSGGICGNISYLCNMLGASAKGLHAWIGPAINGVNYEVGEKVIDAVCSESSGISGSQADLCYLKGRANRWQVDLQSAVVFALLNLNIEPSKICVLRQCTFELSAKWYSYRRTNPLEGQNWSRIELKPI